MKKAVIVGKRKAGLVEVPDPEPKKDWVLVKVQAAPMCTEYKAFIAGRNSDFLGHEAVGEVTAVAQPGPVRVGDRVVVMPQYPCGKCPLCIGGEFIHCENNYDFAKFVGSPEGSATMAQYLLKPSWLLPLIPEGVSYEHASLALCALGPTFGAFGLMDVDSFDTVLITGAGPVGLGGIINARFRGARVIVAEFHPWRVKKAKELGAEAVIDPRNKDCVEQIKSLSNGIGVDKAVDCSGTVAAHRICIDATRRKGHVAFVGECGEETPLKISPDMIQKGLTLHGSWHYNLSRFPEIMKVIQHSPLIDQLISHVFPLSKIQEAFAVSVSHDCAKIILKPWQ